ncbi:MAG: NAD-dependent epimerase/dehydratase family protein [Burkholderiales bacterium]
MGSENTALVTGAIGFIGRALCEALAASGHRVRRAVRQSDSASDKTVAVGDIGPDTDWGAALEGVNSVVHLAARTHVLRETAADSPAAYRRTNVAGTERLARAAAARGVRRLVYLSSVKVNGERTGERPYREEDVPRPEDPYGVSKAEAERALAAIAKETGFPITVLRPPLVYGPGVKGNFLRLLRLVARGVPLPLGTIDNRRSFIYVGNLVDAIVQALDAPRAAGRTYLAADGEDLSTPGLVRALASALGVKPRLVSFPLAPLKFAAKLAGRGAEFARLADSLQVDSTRIRRELDWRPRYTPAQGLAETARWYHGNSVPRS